MFNIYVLLRINKLHKIVEGRFKLSIYKDNKYLTHNK